MTVISSTSNGVASSVMSCVRVEPSMTRTPSIWVALYPMKLACSVIVPPRTLFRK